MSRGIQVVYLMSKPTIEEVLHLLGESMVNLEISARLLHDSHDRLLAACKAALPDDPSDRLPWHGLLTDAIDKAPKP